MQLEWSRHSAQVVSAISGLLDTDQSLKDVTLSAQGRQLKAHRLMLAAASEYFKVKRRGAGKSQRGKEMRQTSRRLKLACNYQSQPYVKLKVCTMLNVGNTLFKSWK